MTMKPGDLFIVSKREIASVSLATGEFAHIGSNTVMLFIRADEANGRSRLKRLLFLARGGIFACYAYSDHFDSISPDCLSLSSIGKGV